MDYGPIKQVMIEAFWKVKKEHMVDMTATEALSVCVWQMMAGVIDMYGLTAESDRWFEQIMEEVNEHHFG